VGCVGTREPLWCVVLVGWVATTWLGGAWEPPPLRNADTTADVLRPAPDPERASARELRRLPGIGETRALEIVRDRWERRATGAPLEWGSIRGVGPLTERRIREALAEWTTPSQPP
jgi:hypothetical protein